MSDIKTLVGFLKEKIKDIDDEKRMLENILSSSKFKLLKFGADWCGPCVAIKPVVKKFVEDLEGKIDFFDIDIGDKERKNEKLASVFQVNGIPRFVVLNEKNETVFSDSGTLAFQNIKRNIDKILNGEKVDD